MNKDSQSESSGCGGVILFVLILFYAFHFSQKMDAMRQRIETLETNREIQSQTIALMTGRINQLSKEKP